MVGGHHPFRWFRRRTARAVVTTHILARMRTVLVAAAAAAAVSLTVPAQAAAPTGAPTTALVIEARGGLIHVFLPPAGTGAVGPTTEAVDAQRQQILDSFIPHGFIGLTYYDSGARSLYNSVRPVRSLADLKGLKVRVQATATEDTMFPAYGAQTVHMPFGEVYTSLQTGVVNVAENGVNVYLANKHYEVAPVLLVADARGMRRRDAVARPEHADGLIARTDGGHVGVGERRIG